MTMFGSQWLANAGGASYEIEQSIRFNDDDAAYLYRDNSSAQTDTKKFTYSLWIKRGHVTGGTNTALLSGGSGTTSGRSDFLFTAGSATGDSTNDALKFDIYTGGWTQRRTTSLLRDPSAWYHIVLVYDAANSTANDTLIIYQNGTRLTLDSTSGVPNNLSLVNANSQRTKVGADASNTPVEFDGYMAEINMIDGQALAPTALGETNDDGVWVPKAYSGTYGNNGFYITGATASDLGEDFSGNNNDFTSTGLATTDQMLDTPTNNFCTLNPVEPNWGGAVTLSDGNLALAGASGTVWNNAVATFKTLPSTGKWIWASEPNTSGGGRGDPWIVNETGLASRNNYVYINANGWETTFDSSSVHTVLNNGAGRNASFSYGAGDFNVVCFDADSKKLWFGVYDVSAGTLQFHDGSTGLTGDPAAGNNPTFTLTGNEFSIGFATYTGRSGVVDFGQSNLLSQFTAPTDFKTLCTANLPTPSVTDGSAHFQPTIYTGNGSTLEVNQSGNSTFQPDWVWGKRRNGAESHALFDAVRGTTKIIYSNLTNAETTNSGLTAFDADGFTIGSSATLNTNTGTYVAWQWKANGAGSANTDGSINTNKTSANATAGFSVIEWSGTAANGTIGHGLGIQPSLYIVKNTATTNSWMVGSTLYANTKFLNLNATAALDTAAAVWNSTYPTSSVINLGSNVGSNGSGTNNMICYAFAEIPGYSSIGSYKGNGSTDGTFVYTGFTPRYVLFKRTNAAESWPILDTARGSSFGADAGTGGDNPTAANDLNNVLVASTIAAEEDNSSGSRKASFNSNGFKVRTTNTAMNGSGSTYIYMAFAEHPFGGDGVAPATAR